MNIIIIAVALCGQCTNGKCNAGPQLSVEQRQQMLLDSSNGNLAAQYSNQQTCNNGQYNSQYQQPPQSQSQEFAYPSMEEMNLRLLYQKALQEPLTEEEAIQYRKTRYAVEMQRREALTRANRIAAFARMNERARYYAHPAFQVQQNMANLQGAVQQEAYNRFFNGLNYGWNGRGWYGW